MGKKIDVVGPWAMLAAALALGVLGIIFRRELHDLWLH